MMTNTYTAEQIEKIGGRRWTKAGHDRVYLNADVWAPLIGLDVEFYGTGNVRGATLEGTDNISNTRTTALLSARVFWEDGQVKVADLVATANRVRVGVTGELLADRLAMGIARQVAEVSA